MADMKAFDERGLYDKMAECRAFLEQFTGQETFEREMDAEQFLDAVITGISAAIELLRRGHAPQEYALAAYLEKYKTLAHMSGTHGEKMHGPRVVLSHDVQDAPCLSSQEELRAVG